MKQAVSTEAELAGWFEEEDKRFAKENAEKAALAKQAARISFADMKFAFKRELYRKAIGA